VDLAQPNPQTAASVVAASANKSQDLATQFALAYTKMVLGMGVQSVHRAPALLVAVYERTSFLVLRLKLVERSTDQMSMLGARQWTGSDREGVRDPHH